ncbi:AMP-binding protein [Micromonospora sp. WMMC415]|uniref:acyl-CoA synthetase n=1 Tax=Micromonospora sp. WMMC415 TaxID=2675222 RepID=UPI0012B44E68|nr:acyl-CoA synthetase [Micromonospora sp. WMMC415]QGN48024.1 AMP-binding protein [Micromonospora sp. WMMC415]
MTVLFAPHWSAHLAPGVEADLGLGATLAGAWTARWAANPGAEVIATPSGRSVTAAELEQLTAAAAGRYAAAGLSPGDRVLVSAGPSVELVVAYLAALRYGLTVVPANTAYTAIELANLAADSQPSLAVLDDVGRAPDITATTPDLAGLPASQPTPLDRVAPADPALIVYTSGTTGKPKGAVLSHANLLASAHAVRLAWRWTPEDRLALSLPLFHIHGLGVGLHGALVAGGSLLLVPRFEPAAIASAIDAGATMFFGVPTMYHRLAASPYLDGLSRLRLAVSGSAPLPADLHDTVRERTGQRILERYGMTETIMLVSNPYDGPRRPGTVGLPLPGVSVRLAPREGGVAEIEVAGPNVFGGYLDRPQATAEAFTNDGWFRTGDLGVLDDDGYLRISGRAKELIITGGYNVYPREVEDALRSHPGVADAAVVGRPSAEWGEMVVAHVVPADAVDASVLERELTEWCTERLAPYKRPRAWRWVETLPRNALGKILRHRLP